MIGHSPYLVLIVLLPLLGFLLSFLFRKPALIEALGILASAAAWILVASGYILWSAEIDRRGFLVQTLWAFSGSDTAVIAVGLAMDPLAALFSIACLVSASAAALMLLSRGSRSLGGMGAALSGLLLVVLSDGPLTAFLGWGLLILPGLLASGSSRNDEPGGNLSSSLIHLIPFAGMAAFLLILAWNRPESLSWAGLGEGSVGLVLPLGSNMTSLGIGTSCLLLFLLPSMGAWPFTPWWSAVKERSSWIGAAAIVIAARAFYAAPPIPEIQGLLVLAGGVTAILGFFHGLGLARTRVQESIRFARAGSHGLSLAAIGLGFPELAVAMEAAFLIAHELILMPLAEPGLGRTGQKGTTVRRTALLVGAAGLALFPLSLGYGPASRLIGSAYSMVLVSMPYLGPLALTLLLLAVIAASAWMVDLYRTASAGSDEGSFRPLETGIVGAVVILAIAAGLAALPGIPFLEESVRPWGDDPIEPDVGNSLLGLLLVFLSGSCLAIYSTLKKDFSLDEPLSGPVLSPLFRVSNGLMGETMRTVAAKVLFSPLAAIADFVVVRVSERVICEKILFEGIGLVLGYPVKAFVALISARRSKKERE